MRKTLVAVAAALAFGSLSAHAGDIQMYGLIDVGLSYVHSDADQPGVDSVDKFTMENASEFGSRWGIRGTEDLGNGYKVGFVLESGFKSDDGTLDQGGRLFGREAHIDLYSPYGTLSAGVLPIFGSVLGANGLFRAIDPLFANYTVGFGSGFATASKLTRVNNALSYVTPTFSGVTGYAMYSFQTDTTDDKNQVEGKSSADRYASLALRYQNASLEGILVADTTLYSNQRQGEKKHSDDGFTITVGGNYKFDSGLKFVTFYQYFQDQELNTAQRGGVAATALTASRAIKATALSTAGARASACTTRWPAARSRAKSPTATWTTRTTLTSRAGRWPRATTIRSASALPSTPWPATRRKSLNRPTRKAPPRTATRSSSVRCTASNEGLSGRFSPETAAHARPAFQSPRLLAS